MAEKRSFESEVKELEKIIKEFEENSSNIDDAIDLHRKAEKKLKECEEILNEASQKIEMYKRDEN